ncbi:MAG TPA: tetratricopeptide repeat protein, partial [Ardenticatenaceae bacterium]|nr:tetratricopeptide repeat protein [Ardenticatenaceae bacterium]
EVLYEECLVLFQRLEDKRGIAWSSRNFGVLARYLGEYERAKSLYEESLALFRSLNHPRGIASSLRNLGTIARFQGDFERATLLYEESLELFRALTHTRGIAWSLRSLGLIALHRGEYQRAGLLLQESLSMFRELGDRRVIAWSLQSLGSVARHTGDHRRAARLFGAVEALRDAINASLPPADRDAYNDDLAALRAELGEAELASTWMEGRALQLEATVDEALEQRFAEERYLTIGQPSPQPQQ